MAWALSVDFAKASGGFAGDAATYYTLGHSLAHDLDFEYRRDDLARVWKEFPSGPEGIFLKRGSGGRIFYAKAYVYPLVAAPFIWLFGTNGFLVLHALLMTAVFRVRVCVPGRAQSSRRRADLRVRVSVRVGRADLHGAARPGLLHLRDRPDRLFLLVLQGSRRTARRIAPNALRTRWLLAPRSDTVAAVLLGVATFAKPTNVGLIMPLLVSAALRKQWAAARQDLRRVRRRRGGAVRAEHRAHRRLELPGRRAQDVLRRR